MARRNSQELAFTALTIEGGLLAPDFLNKIAHLDATEQSESDYDIPRGLKLRDEIGRYWKIAQNLWQDFAGKRVRTDLDAHTVTVRDFLEPFCRQVLGFADLRAVGQVTVAERNFPIGFSAVDGMVPVVFAAHDQMLDKPSARHGDTVGEGNTQRIRRRSPFLLVQEFLNASEDSLWAVVTNGLKFRVLRDNPSLTRPAYIEADLEAIFTEGLYPDFTALWLLAHGSRFGKPGKEPADCILERWRNTAQEDGIRARDRLREGVTEALRALGTGFVSHPNNSALREQLDHGTLTAQRFYEQLLQLIYRFIFLATIEDRELVHSPDATKEVMQRYQAGYSLGRLRKLAARRRSYDRHSDHWQALKITFGGLGKGMPALGLPALGGLFKQDQCPDLDSAQLDNKALLTAIFSLCFFREGASLSRVNYRDMDSEELGSVYESLLELVPMIQVSAGMRRFGFIGDEEVGSTKGNARKLTGSYYTPDSLVQELIKSALDPVLEDTIRKHPDDPVKALLSLAVCDPACGSGHFLLAASRRIAEEVARLKAVDGNPLPEDYRHALRDVVAHCIYGVDKNPMAVELARTALWLEAYTPDRPLTFLDHHLRCGDALLGIVDPAILEKGIPDKAFNALSGDNKDVVRNIKKKNRDAMKSIAKAAKDAQFMLSLAIDDQSGISEVDTLPDSTLEEIETKRQAFEKAEKASSHSKARLAADLFVAAFVIPKTKDLEEVIPTSADLQLVLNGNPPRVGVIEAAEEAVRESQAFHWWHAFPQVKAKGGFDVLLGNPPWERIKLQEEEFFASRSPLVAEAQHKAERGKRIELLRDGMLLHTLYPEVEAAQGLFPPNQAEQHLYLEFLSARRVAEASSLYAHDSERFPLTGVGDVNTYALFSETFLQLASETGRAGFIVPTGIATDDSTKAYFENVSQSKKLVSLYDFRTGPGLFSEIGHQRFKFCLITLGHALKTSFLFFALEIAHLLDKRRYFTLTQEDFKLLNPNTLTCPTFRTRFDADLTLKLHRTAKVLIEEGTPDKNPWGIKFLRMFDMAGDSNLFKDSRSNDMLPLYEAKMIHQFDHRWATYRANGESDDLSEQERADVAFSVTPRYWLSERAVNLKISRLPDLILKPMRDGHTELIVLSVAIIMFSDWLRERYGDDVQGCMPHLFQEWREYVTRHQFARRFDPTSLGLGGDNPTCFKPLDGSYLPCAPIDQIVATDDRHTGWIAPDPNMLGVLLGFSANFPVAIDRRSPVTADDQAMAIAEEWLVKSCPTWLMGWRDICRSTDYRTLIANVIPKAAVGDKFLLMFPSRPTREVAVLLANLNSLVCDYAARQKVGGTSFKYYTMKQIPVLPPEHYTTADFDFIVPRVLELTYNANDMRPWASEIGYDGDPYPWNPERRSILRAELDAYFAKLYGLDRDELRYILEPADVMGPDYPSETFRVMKNNEIREFGEYRTQRLVLEAWDRLEKGLH